MDPMVDFEAALGEVVAEAAALEALDMTDALDAEGRGLTGEVAVIDGSGLMTVRVPDAVEVGRSVEASLMVLRL